MKFCSKELCKGKWDLHEGKTCTGYKDYMEKNEQKLAYNGS